RASPFWRSRRPRTKAVSSEPRPAVQPGLEEIKLPDDGGNAIDSATTSLPGPRHDRHRADGVRRRAIDDLRTDREVDQRVVRAVGYPVDPRRLEEDARLLAEHLVVLGELRQLDGDRADLAAGDGEVRRILVEPQRLTPAALARLRYVTGDARHLGVVEIADADLVVGRQQVERRADAAEIFRPRHPRQGEEQGGREIKQLHVNIVLL